MLRFDNRVPILPPRRTPRGATSLERVGDDCLLGAGLVWGEAIKRNLWVRGVRHDFPWIWKPCCRQSSILWTAHTGREIVL